MDNFEKCNYWLSLSNDDLNTAKVLLKSKILLQSGYYCNQVIEKAFKAAITKVTQEVPPKIHDLPKLAQKCSLWKNLSDNQKELLKKLIPLQIEARYPQYKEKIFQTLSVKYCEELVKETEDFLCWIKKQLEE